MRKNLFYYLFLSCFLKTSICFSNPSIYVFLGKGPLTQYEYYWRQPVIEGAQIIYSWRELEPRKNQYDFHRIEHDIKRLAQYQKSLVIQIQDKSFSPNVINVPDYLISPEYEGGIAKQIDFPGEGKKKVVGWVAKQWVPSINYRFRRLIQKLGKRFDGKIEAINLSETSIDLDPEQKDHSFSCDKYMSAVILNVEALKKSFTKSEQIQYVNYFPCEWQNDKDYMGRLFDYAVTQKVGLGNPDTVPYRKGQMENSYPFFHQYQNQLRISMAIQSPDYTYIDESTGKPFTVATLYDFAVNYLGASRLFWTVAEPEFTEKVLPFLLLNRRH